MNGTVQYYRYVILAPAPRKPRGARPAAGRIRQSLALDDRAQL